MQQGARRRVNSNVTTIAFFMAIWALYELSEVNRYGRIYYGVIVLQGGKPPYTWKRGEVVQMDTYEVLSLLFLGGSFLLALLAYIDNRNNKQK